MGWAFRLADRLRDAGRRRCWAPHLAAGRRGEDLAHRHLQTLGMRVVGRNHRTRGGAGEIDIVALDRDMLVFVEVKTRTDDDVAAPERNVDAGKRRRMNVGIADYLRRAKREGEQFRVDLVTVVLEPQIRIEHYPDALSRRRA
jgi:putative endonuclease